MDRRVLVGIGSLLAIGLVSCGAPGTTASAPTTVTQTVTAPAGQAAGAVSTTTVTVTAPANADSSLASSPAGVAVSTAPAQAGATVGGSVDYSTEYPTGEATATLNSSEWSAEGGQYSGPPKNGTYLIVDVTVESRSGEIAVNPLLWQVRDSDGRTYRSDLGGVDGQLSSGDLPVGGKSRGFVAFDVPQAPVTLELTGFTGPPVATWSIPA